MARLSIRGLDPETYHTFRTAAAGRGLTQAEYLRRLVNLHIIATYGQYNSRMALLHAAELPPVWSDT